MATAAMQQPNPQNPQNPQQAQGDPSQQQAQQMLQKFRPLAEAVQQLGKEFPEGQEEAALVLKGIEKWMTKVAGNPQRVKEAQAPPAA